MGAMGVRVLVQQDVFENWRDGHELNDSHLLNQKVEPEPPQEHTDSDTNHLHKCLHPVMFVHSTTHAVCVR